ENILLHEQNRYQRALKDFSSTLIFIRDIEELSQKVVIKIMDAVKLDFCAIYLKQDGVFSLRSKKAMNHPQLPSAIEGSSQFVNSFNNTNAPVLGDYLPRLENVRLGLVSPLFLNQNLYGFIVLGPKEKDALFTDTDIDAFSIVSNQTSLALSEIYYFNEFQKATEEKYKLLVEKERLQSAFEIAEAYRHELGNILNIISTSLGNLMFIGDTTPTKEEIEQTRKSINNNVKRGHKIFSAISEYNESSKLEPKEARLDELIKAAINDKEEDLSKNNISLKADIGENIALLANDNLISALRYFLEGAIGAIEYVNPKVRLIDIKLKSQDGLAELIISDTGGDATADKLYTGIGIERAKEGGILYFIARRIIFDHQGKLEMVSFDNGKGTSFLIKIPLKKV
ncbi:MAG: GAF domain-containing protein, partial [Candidatus Omnitrophica bacterium]|nr:GAF domain-containing protein [Candidatus Omnitrophota bacterium]